MLDQRLANIMKYASFAIYANVSRALFSEHKITFSFMLATAIQRQAGDISPAEWQLLVVGAGIVDESKLPPCPDGVDMQWVLLTTISERIEPLAGLAQCVAADVGAWRPLMDAEAPWEALLALPAPLDGDVITDFMKLLIIKVFRPEKIVECISQYIAAYMGREYIEQPPLDLHVVFPTRRRRCRSCLCSRRAPTRWPPSSASPPRRTASPRCMRSRLGKARARSRSS